jgi:2-polyprenyl-6-methoxyphenol hydroxylase-like FAD-dependent oxidoreductase
VPNTSVLISGIGIAGPTLAYWLLQSGFDPTLVERAPSLRTGGYIIDFWGLGYDIAERMGLLPDLQGEGYQVEELRFVDDWGHRVGGFGVEVFRELTGGRYLSIPRSGLARLIHGKIEGRCETIFGDSITGIRQSTDGVQVEFEHASARRFDLVIGADGLHSVVRKLAFGSQDRFEKYLGYVVAAFEVKGYRPRDEGVYVSYCVPGKQAARFALRGDRTLFLFVFAAEEPPPLALHDTQGHKTLLLREFGAAGWECRRILATLDQCPQVYFDRVSQIRMDRWWKGRVALVGDAAFAPSLLAGQGSALAMTAAYVLAGEVAAANGRPEHAFNRYQHVLDTFIRGKFRAAEQFAGSFAPKTRLGIFLRNQITKAFRIRQIARLVIGRSLLDRVELPAYSMGRSVRARN